MDAYPRSTIGDMIDSTTIHWFRVDGVDFELWRAVLDVADNGDEITLDVWRQAGQDEWGFDVSTEIYGEIADGESSSLEGAKAKALAEAMTFDPAD